MPVKDCKLAENRVHLLLKEYRVDSRKEFFRLPLQDAESMCSAIGTFEKEEVPASNYPSLHPDLYITQVAPRPSLPVLKALTYVLSATQHNTPMDHLFEERLLVVDGFTSAQALAKYRNSQVQSASTTLRRLAAVAEDLTCSLPGEGKPIHLFAKFVYERGHAAWTFQPEFRRLFLIPTTI